MDKWHLLLSGVISVPVYKEDVPEDEDGNYLLLRAEGGASQNNKRSFADQTVIITDIVTVFENNIDRSVVEAIDGEVNALVLPTRNTGLANPSNTQLHNVNRETFEYITEQDVKKYYRKVSRYIITVYQTN